MHMLLWLTWPAIALGLGTPKLIGAPQLVDDLSEHQQEIVKFAFGELTSGDSSCPKQLMRVENFSEQTVAGTLYKFDFVMTGNKENGAACLNNGVEKRCSIVVWDKPWEKFREVQWDKVNCDNNDGDSGEESSYEASYPTSSEEYVEETDTANPKLVRVPLFHATRKTGNSAESINGKVLGGGDHDYLPHGKKLLGRGNHDFVPHTLRNFGGDGHDTVPHGKRLVGGGQHDYIKHPSRGGGKPHGPRFNKEDDVLSADESYNVFYGKKLPDIKESLKKLSEMQSLDSFHKFMKNHNKVYANKAEYKKRYAIFRENMKKVQFLQETELGTGVYGATHLADVTEEEFKKNYLGLNLLKDDPDIHWPPADIPDVELPKEFDWRTEGAVTPVKNQGTCGSCWAFSVTGNVEGQYAVKNKKLVSLSEQELVDCDTRDSGCNGGLPENAYKTLLEIGGLESEEDYGYDGEDEKCKFNRTRVLARVSGGVEISQNETQMAQWLLKNGPISVGLNANAMQFYMGGVSHPWKVLCSAEGIDHGVLIVGFGVHNYPLFHKEMTYWLIKNSWGPGWGEQGYYRLFRGDGTCGINMMTSSAVLAD